MFGMAPRRVYLKTFTKGRIVFDTHHPNVIVETEMMQTGYAELILNAHYYKSIY